MSLPQKTLGRTGHSATRLGLGGEGVLRTNGNDRQAQAVIEAALAARPEWVLLDNMPAADIAEAVRQTAGRARLEASGGVRRETVAAIAATGVDAISVGALTHSAPALDISLELSF